MAAIHELCVLFAIVVAVSSAEDICTNQWDVSVDGIASSELTIHHSSTSDPGRFTHLVWQWRWRGKPTATIWLSQRPYGKLDGGFVAQPKGLFHIPASFKWSISNGTLRVATHGNIRELSQYPAWNISVCTGAIMWGVNNEKELNVNQGDSNETRSLDDSWALDARLRRRRQAEFPSQPDQPSPESSGFALWWRRFLDSLGVGSRSDDKPRSWAIDLTELILKLIFGGVRGHGNLSGLEPENPDAEVIPTRGYRDVESLSDKTRTTSKSPRLN